jgi:hypothetical protein
MNELRECPFCGGAAKFDDDGQDQWIGCTNCFARAGIGSDDCGPNIMAWNKRHDDWISVEDRLPEVGDRVVTHQSALGGIGNMFCTSYNIKEMVTRFTHWKLITLPKG